MRLSYELQQLSDCREYSTDLSLAGEAAQLSATTLKRLRRERQAHMVFATAVTMAPHGRALLSASADASVCVTMVGPLSSSCKVCLEFQCPSHMWFVPSVVLACACWFGNFGLFV